MEKRVRIKSSDFDTIRFEMLGFTVGEARDIQNYLINLSPEEGERLGRQAREAQHAVRGFIRDRIKRGEKYGEPGEPGEPGERCRPGYGLAQELQQLGFFAGMFVD